MKPLLIIDFRVMAFNIMAKVQSTSLVDKDWINYVKSLWALYINTGIPYVKPVESSCVVVDDLKTDVGYWRSLYYPEYKDGRKPKPDEYASIVSLGHDYVKHPSASWSYLCESGYEADDFAGSIVSLYRTYHLLGIHPTITSREIQLYTVDSDWLQLVGNGVTWYNTGPWEPKIRGTKEAIAWTKKRLKVDIENPREIVDVKCFQGDKSDNLPRNSPRYLIDLLNPPIKYNLRTIKHKELHQVLTDTRSYRNQKHLDNARDYITSRGLPL